jgi:hypothetical protein
LYSRFAPRAEIVERGIHGKECRVGYQRCGACLKTVQDVTACGTVVPRLREKHLSAAEAGPFRRRLRLG